MLILVTYLLKYVNDELKVTHKHYLCTVFF